MSLVNVNKSTKPVTPFLDLTEMGRGRRSQGSSSQESTGELEDGSISSGDNLALTSLTSLIL